MIQKILFVLSIFLMGILVAFRVSAKNNEIVVPKDRQTTLIVKVKSEPKITENGQIIAVGDTKVYTELYPRIKVGDELRIKGKVDESGRIFRADIEKIGESHTLANYFLRLRQEISDKMAKLIPAPESTLLIGETLGVDNISKDFKDVLVRTGRIHVVVVSGQNLMIVVALIMSFTKYIGRKQAMIVSTLAVFAYAALCGFAPPVVRASLMVLAGTVGLFFGRNILPVWNLAMAALVIVLFWPQAIFEVSFQLTFAASLGIITMGKRLAEVFQGPVAIMDPVVQSKKSLLGRLKIRDQRSVISLHTAYRSQNSETAHFSIPSHPFSTAATLKNLVAQNAAIATSAYIFTLPVILFYSGKSSLLSPIVNIFVVELVAPIMVLGFLSAVLVLVFAPLAQIFAYISYFFAFVFVWIVELFAKIPVGEFSLGQGNLWFAAGYYVLLFGVIFLWKRKAQGRTLLS